MCVKYSPTKCITIFFVKKTLKKKKWYGFGTQVLCATFLLGVTPHPPPYQLLYDLYCNRQYTQLSLIMTRNPI